jgi:hypothetical protein
MFVLKFEGRVFAQSTQPIVFHEDQGAWLVIDPRRSAWYPDVQRWYTVEDQTNTDGGPNVVG